MGGTRKGARQGLVGRRARSAWYAACGLAVALSLFIMFQLGAAARAPVAPVRRGPSGESPQTRREQEMPARSARAGDRVSKAREFFRALITGARDTATNVPVQRALSRESRPAAAPLARAKAQEALRAASPLLRECYEALLSEQPDAGSFELQVAATIDADPALGGVVSSAELSGGALDTRPEFARCLRETLLSIEFEADTSVGQASVRFPLRFAPFAAASAERGEPPPR